MKSGDCGLKLYPCRVTTTYLDHAATTPPRPEVVEAMLPWMQGTHGNPSGSHRLARQARRAVDDARDQIADAVGCGPGDVVFTSGGTEANNLAIAGVAAAKPGMGLLCSAIEHHAVLDPVLALNGSTVGVDASGVIDLDDLANKLSESVGLFSLMLVNNEVGSIQPLVEVAELLAEHAPNAVLHSDAVQAFPWLPVSEPIGPAALVSLSAHKIGGPAGVGALVVRAGTPLKAQLLGGGQERDRRSGSHNVAGIVGFGAATELMMADRKAMVERVGALRDRLADGLLAAIPQAYESGVKAAASRSHKIAGNCHLCFDRVEAEALLFLLDLEGICASAASSCASGAAEPSHVLAAMGVDRKLAGGSLRLSLGWDSSEADVDRALVAIPKAIARIRGDDR